MAAEAAVRQGLVSAGAASSSACIACWPGSYSSASGLCMWGRNEGPLHGMKGRREADGGWAGQAPRALEGASCAGPEHTGADQVGGERSGLPDTVAPSVGGTGPALQAGVRPSANERIEGSSRLAS